MTDQARTREYFVGDGTTGGVLADNTTGAITAQDVRDLVASVPLSSELTIGSPAIVYASEAGCAMDSAFSIGGGTDDTSALQAILDQAQTHPLHLVIDGFGLVSATLLTSKPLPATPKNCASCGVIASRFAPV